MEIAKQVEAFVAASRWDLEKMNRMLDALQDEDLAPLLSSLGDLTRLFELFNTLPEAHLDAVLDILVKLTRAVSSRISEVQRRKYETYLANRRKNTP